MSLDSCKYIKDSALNISGKNRLSLERAVVPLILERNDDFLGHCTGTLIVEGGVLFLLTAAHCIEENPKVYVVEERFAFESYEEWLERVNKSNKKIRVDTMVNKFYDESFRIPSVIAQNDFALAMIKESDIDSSLYKSYYNSALTIGFDEELHDLNGHVKYVGTGHSSDKGEPQFGIKREGSSNLKAEKLNNMETIKVDKKSFFSSCTKTCIGDSGGPLIYTNPNTGKKSVIGVLFEVTVQLKVFSQT